MQKRMIGLVLGGIVVGCASSQVVTSLAPSKAHADGEKRWEYACYATDPGEKFNALGRQGWELVGWGGSPPGWCFKRAF